MAAVQFGRSVTSDSLRPHQLQHARRPWSLPQFMSTESVMPSNHLILCHPLLLLPSVFSSISLFQQKLQHPTPLGLDPAPLGAPTKPRCIPARSVWAAHRESVRPGSPRASPQEKRTKSGPSFPKGPGRLNHSRLIKTWPARPHPPVVCNLCVCFWLGNGLGRMGRGWVTTRIPLRLFVFPSTQSLPPPNLACKLPPAHGGRQRPWSPPAPIHRAWLSHSLLIIFYKSNATQFFPHYREPWGGCSAIG